MLGVLSLFLIPVGGGIPAGVLLAAKQGLSWPVMSFLYFVSDVILAVVFEPMMLGVIAVGKRIPSVARVAEAVRASTAKTAAKYGGPGVGPFALILVAFGVDPMTGRAAAHAAGHGFVSGWAIAITGDMFYFWVVALATLKLNRWIGNPEGTMAAVLLMMVAVPALIKRWRMSREEKR